MAQLAAISPRLNSQPNQAQPLADLRRLQANAGPSLPLPKAMGQMNVQDRIQYMVQVATPLVPGAVVKELQGLLSWQNMAMLGAFVGAQSNPVTAVLADMVAVILLGADVVDTGGKVAGAIAKVLTTQSPAELANASQEMAQLLVHGAAMVAGGRALKTHVGGKVSTFKNNAPVRHLESSLGRYQKGQATVTELRQAVIAANHVRPPTGRATVMAGLQATGTATRAAAENRSTTKAPSTQSNHPPAAGAKGPLGRFALSAKTPKQRLDLAIKARNFQNSAHAITDLASYKFYLKLMDGQPVSTLLRVGIAGVSYGEKTLHGRTAAYRHAGEHLLPAPSTHQPVHLSTAGLVRHDLHTAFGSVSKLGEVHANSPALSRNSRLSWSERGVLPGHAGMPLKGFWRVDFGSQWKLADKAAALLQQTQAESGGGLLAKNVVKPLARMGFIPKGSKLAARLEQLEARFLARDSLQFQLSKATPKEAPALQTKLVQAQKDLATALADARSNNTKIAGQLLEESLGTPQTTFELTVRHAAAARYMQTVEGQAGAVFEYTKFEAILKQVRAEAGDASQVGSTWHRELLASYGADADFMAAMAQRPAMAEAWAAYKQKCGL